jgi:predicted short-subunit dehydrogenase-like oxidoreductase (DUF2520 family)
MKLKIAIIGAGKISYSLVSALIKANHSVISVVSRSITSSEALAKKFSIKHYTSDLKNIPKAADIYFLTVPDGKLRITALQLSKLKLKFDSSVFIHLSGAEDISVLKSLVNKGGKTASLHLMQTFPSKKIVSLKNVHAAIETNDESVYKFLFKLTGEIQLIPFRIDSAAKVYYHLAGVFASNFLAGNLYSSMEMFSLNNIEKSRHFDILSSTINSTLENIRKAGPANALSGPIERGDIKTIRNHISSLKKLNRISGGKHFTQFLKNYIVQSLNLLNLVEDKYKQLKNSHQKIKKLLVQELAEIEDSS